MTTASDECRVLVFRPGQLGDTIVALPALHLIRKSWPRARVTLLHDVHGRADHPTAREVLGGSGLVDDFIAYTPAHSRLGELGTAAKLLLTIRPRRFDTFVYLAPVLRTTRQRVRDMRMVRLWGIGKVIGDVDLPAPGTGVPPGEACAFEADDLLKRLASSGMQVPGPNQGCMDLGLSESEMQLARNWLASSVAAGHRVLLAIGPGSKMPAKRWPLDRYELVVRDLVARFDVWPIVFGGPDEAGMGADLVRRWGRGTVAAGTLRIRTAAAVLAQCALYLGNDTGTMHLAAAAGIPCVALFSARDTRGTWYPYGPQAHVVFREAIECERCMLTECIERDNECLKRIDAGRVVQAASRLVEALPGNPHRRELQSPC